MTFQYSVAVRNAKLDAEQTAIGPSPIMRIFSGAEPLNCAAADPSGLLCTITLPAVWMSPSVNGIKSLAGTWSNTSSASGAIACWRIYDSTGTTCHIQGNTNDMTFTSVNIISGRLITVVTFQITSGNS